MIKGDALSIRRIRSDLRCFASKAKAKDLQRFFKTGPGEYGEGDRFLGVTVPNTRKVAKANRDADRGIVTQLISSEYHEERLLALLILVDQYQRGDADTRTEIFDYYCSNFSHINNWDLVDLSADKIVGAHLFKAKKALLWKLAESENLWERRIAIVATFYFIKNDSFAPTVRIARMLLSDPEDLIHKAVGWMLREVGKRNLKELERFLDRYGKQMPRTMLRYAIERFPETRRKQYLESTRS